MFLQRELKTKLPTEEDKTSLAPTHPGQLHVEPGPEQPHWRGSCVLNILKVTPVASRAEQPSFSSGKEPLTVYMSAQKTGRNALCVEISLLRSAHLPIQGHMVNHLDCVGHRASVINIQLCWYSAKVATAITNQRSRNKIDPLLTKTGRLGFGTLGWSHPPLPL